MPPSLTQTERWMQAMVLHTGTAEEALRSPKASRQIPASRMPVLPSKTLTALERVDVYREMYWMRMREALSIDYPELQRFLGNVRFDQLCDAYVQECPSHSYTLNRLGDHLPRFLAEGGFDGLKRRAFDTDLARLELMMTEVFDEAEAPVLNEEQVARVPVDAWDGMKLRAIGVAIEAVDRIAAPCRIIGTVQFLDGGNVVQKRRRGVIPIVEGTGFLGVEIAHHRILAAVLSVHGIKCIGRITAVIGTRMIEANAWPISWIKAMNS